MHWMNGEFHESLHVHNTIYVNEREHVGIIGENFKTIYGEDTIASEMRGNGIMIHSEDGPLCIESTGDEDKSDITITAYDSITMTSENETIIETLGDYSDITLRTNDGSVIVDTFRDVDIRSNSGDIKLTTYSYGYNVEIKANDGNVLIEAGGTSGADVTIKSADGDVFIDARETIQLSPGKNLILKNTLYGTSLPTSGKAGQVYFKLIS